jgi:chromatin remodeling complex protein RSC6
MIRESVATRKKIPVKENEVKKPVRRVLRRIPVSSEETEHEPEPVTPMITTPGGTRKRREVNAETIDAAFSELCEYIEGEIARQKEIPKDNKHVGNLKFLKSSLKKTRTVQRDVRRVVHKKRATRVGNNNSGFMKETTITDEMADFLNVEHGTKMSRVECTKKLHSYIKEHDLQNPENRREIRPDSALAKLLRFNKKEHGPLMYYIMQKLIQQHFIKE